jgi:glutamate synthase (NADPH) large chain
MRTGRPLAQGLYDPDFEHDACGVAFVVDLKGRSSHTIVEQGLRAVCSLEHRGASGAEKNTGDGAGMLLQVPDRFLRAVADVDLPPVGQYATGIAFLPRDPDEAGTAATAVEKLVGEEGLRLLEWRDVPTDDSMIGASAANVQPLFRQLFVAGPAGGVPWSGLDLERRVFVLRKRIEHEVNTYFASLSSRTLVYKGMLTPSQLRGFYPDLADERMESALALVHSRFSTNTFPSWPLAHPYRYLAHNGEINTLKGNRNWMRAREALLESDLFPGPLSRTFPICTPDASDSASFDEALELLHLGGRSLPHAVLMMIPEAWENHQSMNAEKKAFYRFHASVMEPWDGPASIAFTDGTVIGAVLDRNGLRPSRYWVTSDDLVIMASEVGVLDLPPENILIKERLHPGRIFLVDTARGCIVQDEEIKRELAAAQPYGEWLAHLVDIEDLPAAPHLPPSSHETVRRRQQLFGYTDEDLRVLLASMAATGEEPLGSMGTDTALAALSDRPRLLYDYFKQLFAQVTNPPLDAIREELVTSMASTIGPEGNLLDPRPESCRQIKITHPVIDNDQLAKLRYV